MSKPSHIAIIMDGNGRWAERRKLPRSVGHEHGVIAAENIIKCVKKLDIQYLTLYVLSTENKKRPVEELENLMILFVNYLRTKIQSIAEDGGRIIFRGSKNGLNDETKTLMQDAEDKTASGHFFIIIAFNYSGRDEIRQAAFDMAKFVLDKKNTYSQSHNINLTKQISDDYNKVSCNEVEKELFDKFMNLHNIPDPDLLIRTGGELRISNFLLWQLAYTELYFTEKLWPDFKESDLLAAIKEFGIRERRYGNTHIK